MDGEEREGICRTNANLLSTCLLWTCYNVASFIRDTSNGRKSRIFMPICNLYSVVLLVLPVILCNFATIPSATKQEWCSQKVMKTFYEMSGCRSNSSFDWQRARIVLVARYEFSGSTNYDVELRRKSYCTLVAH